MLKASRLQGVVCVITWLGDLLRILSRHLLLLIWQVCKKRKKAGDWAVMVDKANLRGLDQIIRIFFGNCGLELDYGGGRQVIALLWRAR